MGFGHGIQARTSPEESHVCIFNHELVGEGGIFRLLGSGGVRVRVDEDFVRIGCVRMKRNTWRKLVERVEALLGSDKLSA